MGKNIGFKGPDRVSISTLKGRVVVPFVMGKYQAERFGCRRASATWYFARMASGSCW